MKAADVDYPSEFQTKWTGAFGETLPLGWTLRHANVLHWTRFHALPLSKRYAETLDETNAIVERAAKIVNFCFEANTPTWIVVPVFADDIEHVSPALQTLKLTEAMTVLPSEDDQFEDECKFYARKALWTGSQFEYFINNIADETIRGLMYSENNETVFAPYDGGFDIFTSEITTVQELETAFADWMSGRSDKL